MSLELAPGGAGHIRDKSSFDKQLSQLSPQQPHQQQIIAPNFARDVNSNIYKKYQKFCFQSMTRLCNILFIVHERVVKLAQA